MRGLSFSVNRRSRGSATDKVTSSPTSPQAPSPSTSSSSSSLRLFKKLSSSLRRRDSSTRPTRPDHLPPLPSDDLSALPPLPPALPPAKARALTFAAGEPPADRAIPFFETTSAPIPAPPAAVAVVRGKPEWQRRPASDDAGSPVSDPGTAAEVSETALSAATSDDEQPAEPALKTLPALPAPKNAPLRDNANTRLPPPLPREHALSFSAADRPRRAGIAARAKSVSVPEKDVPVKGVKAIAQRKKISRRRNGQRWLLPLAESKEKPRVFTPPAGTAFERISARRDRTEARALVSACTYLEAEVLRMRGLLSGEGDAGKCCCQKGKGGAECECAMRRFVEQSVDRMKGVLKILEDRYDTIEQVYIKSEEYAVAMGRFFEVSPQVINKLAAGHHDLANAPRENKHKSLR